MLEKLSKKQEILYEKLFSDIASGVYAPGQRIPNDTELAKTFGVSRPTVAEAVKMLEQKGIVSRKVGVGTFVREQTPAAQQKIGLLMPRLFIAPQDYGHFVTLTSMIISEISRRAHEEDHILLLNDLPYGDEKQIIGQAKQICQQLIDMQVKGVFFMPFELSPENQSVNAEIAQRFRLAGIAVTLIDRDVYNDGRRSVFDIVCVDNEQAAFDITNHLAGLECKNIHFVSAWIDVTSITKRVRGYRSALKSKNLPSSRDHIHRLNYLPFVEQDKNIEEKIVHDFLENLEADALVCVNDRIASIIMKYALEMGLRIPEDLRVVGFDDEPFGAYLPVPLTTMRQPATALGAEAIRTLLSRAKRPDMPPREVMLTAELVVRKSCGSTKGTRNETQGLNGNERKI